MKKSTVIALCSVLGACILAASPFVYKKIKAVEAEKELTARYEAYISSNTVFYDNTFINGIDVSGMTPDDASESVYRDFLSGTILIESPYASNPEEYSYSKLSVSKDGIEALTKDLYQSQTLTRDEFVSGALKREYSYDFSKDIDFEKSDFSSLAVFDDSIHEESEDAFVAVDPVTKKTSITKEVYGTRIDRNSFVKKIKNAVSGKNESVILDKTDFVCPAVLSTDGTLLERKDFLDVLLSKSLIFNVCGIDINLGPDDLYKLYDFSSDEYINEEALAGYVEGLKKKYDTYGIMRPFLTSTGIPVIVSGGDFGWRINRDSTIEALKGAILTNSVSSKGEAVYDIKGQRPANNEISNTYVEISLEDQKIWMYINGECVVADDCTTGDTTDPACASHSGMFRLVFKNHDVVLKGPTWEDFVSFWMNFDGNNGMHDASWRTDEEFGGTNRDGNGSHGCTNLRYNTAAIIYNNIQYDTPIIVW